MGDRAAFKKSYFLASVQETQRLAEALAPALRPGDWVLLEGPMGSGKTALARRIIQALISEDTVVASPTFSLVLTYESDQSPARKIVHADLWRLEPSGTARLDLDLYAASHILLIEWPDRLPALPEDPLKISLKETNGDAPLGAQTVKNVCFQDEETAQEQPDQAEPRLLTLEGSQTWAKRLESIKFFDVSSVTMTHHPGVPVMPALSAATSFSARNRFLDFSFSQGWHVAEVIQPDCSKRSYFRLVIPKSLEKEGFPALLMDLRALSDPKKTTKRVVTLSSFLHKIGLKAPRTFAASEHGFVAQEFFGTQSFKKTLQQHPQALVQQDFWDHMGQGLAHLAHHTYATASPEERCQQDSFPYPPFQMNQSQIEFFAEGKSDDGFGAMVGAEQAVSLESMNCEFFLFEIQIFLQYGLPLFGVHFSELQAQQALLLWKNALLPLDKEGFGSVLTLGDVHTENILDLAHPTAQHLNSVAYRHHNLSAPLSQTNAPWQRYGFIDYQDALWGPPAYDLVSFLQDVRVPFDPVLSEDRRRTAASYMTTHRRGSPAILPPPEAFSWPYDLLGLQRATKIIGVFARLFLTRKKSDMLRYIPTCLAIVEHTAARVQNTALKQWFESLDLGGRLKKNAKKNALFDPDLKSLHD